MSPLYRQGEAYSHPYPVYISATPNGEPQPIWFEPREPQPHYYYREAQPHYYYRETPTRPWLDEWNYNEDRPHLYHYPAESGCFYYPPKFRNSPPRFYEPDGMDFARENFSEPDGREFRRDFRPIYVYPPSSDYGPGSYAYRPFHPGEQFRHPGEYPIRFVPSSYGPSEQRRAHCCGCPNHVCHTETKTMKEIEPKQITDGKPDVEVKPKSQNLHEFPGPVMVFPSGCRNRYSSPERKDRIEETEQHPVYWIPVNSNSRDRKGEEKEQSPAYWFPVNWIRNNQTQDHDPRFQGSLTPLASNTIPQDEKENKKDAPVEGQLHPLPLIWIPDGLRNVSNTNTQEKSKSLHSQASCEDNKKTNGVESRPVVLQEIGKDDGNQKPAEVKKEIKARFIPVKQLEEEKPAEKSSQPQKTQEKVGDQHQKTLPKSSKLPPVCLRVDPLPGKQKSSGKSSSRSPSPPHKSENPKESASSSDPMENANRDASSKIFVEAKKAEENAKMNVSKNVEEKIDASTKANIGTGKPKEDVKVDDLKVAENESRQSKEAEIKKRELSRDDAVLKIQAFYRGCEVRRLQPLKKLREIAKIRERVKELKQRISSPEFVRELSRDEKAKGRTQETLMGLLLQLDTIRGLHPLVRDVRKAVAREIVLLQEKLDTWTEEVRNNNMQQQQSCMQGSTENNVRIEEEVIEKHDKDWEATEGSDMTLQNSNIENQGVDKLDIEASKGEEKAHDKQDSLEIEKETSGEDRKETPVTEEISNEEKDEATTKECSDDRKQNVTLEGKNYATEHSENVQGNALLNQEATEIYENVETSALSVVEMENHDKDAVVSEQMIGTSDNILENKNEERKEILAETISVSNSEEVYLESMKAEAEEKSEPQTNIDPVLPQDLDMQMEVLPLSTLVQEQEISDVGKSTILHQSTGEDAFQGEVVLGVPEAEPENKIIEEKIEVSFSEANKSETEDLQNGLTEDTVGLGDKHLESYVAVSSEANFDIASGSLSDGYEENNLILLENQPPVEDNASGKGEFAVALAQETYNPVIQESIEVPTEEDAFDVNSKDEFSNHNEKRQEDHSLKCSGLSDYMEFRASDSADKFVMEPLSPNDPHSENLIQSEANIPQHGSKQNEESWKEENEKLREMVEKLVECGKQQMSTIARLNDKIKSLESKLGKGHGKNKARARHVKLKNNMVGRNPKNTSALGC